MSALGDAFQEVINVLLANYALPGTHETYALPQVYEGAIGGLSLSKEAFESFEVAIADLTQALLDEISARAGIDTQLAEGLNLTNSRIDNLLYDPVSEDSSRNGKRLYLNEFLEVFSVDQVDGLEQRFALFTNALSGKISDIIASAGTGLTLDKTNPAFPIISQNRPFWNNIQSKPSELDSITTILAGKENTFNKGNANGYASLDAGGKIPASQIPGNFSLQIVADITERNALILSGNTTVLVLDASLDSTVTSGHAYYVYDFANTQWIKTSEQESLDIIFSWANVTGKPTEFTPTVHSHDANEISTNSERRFVSDTEKALWNNTALVGATSGTNTVQLANNRIVTFALTGNIELSALLNPVANQVYVFYFLQDATGGRTIWLPSNVKIPSGETPDLTANKKSILTMYYDGTEFLGSWKKGW